MTDRYDKILGCLLGAAIGDAMGAPLETRPVYLVKEDFGNGNFIYDYMPTKEDAISAHMPQYWVTDDFSVAYISAKHFLKDGGKITPENSKEAVLDWKNNPDTKIFFDKYGGPSTRKAIAKIEGTEYDRSRDYLFCENKTGTNGGGMKAWMVGLFNQGDIEKAIDDAITMCIVTHDNPIALSAACAVAAATAAAFKDDADVESVCDAAEYGARVGLEKAKKVGRNSTGASVEKRIKLAREIGKKNKDNFEQCVLDMTDLIGTGLNANESCPSAIGYVATDTSVMNTIYMAINSGNDCDTTAIMAGSIIGALRGFKAIDNKEYHLDILSKNNKWINFEEMAQAILEVTEKE